MKKIFITLLTLSAFNANAILVTGSCTPGEKITAYTMPTNPKEKSKILDIERSNFDRYVTSSVNYYGKVAVTNGKKTYIFECQKNSPNDCTWHGANFH